MLLVVPLIVGFLVGFLTVRANYLLIIFLGKVFSTGTASSRFAATGVLASLVVFIGVSLGVPEVTLTGRLVVTALFLGSFTVGVVTAQEESSPQEIRRITEALFETVFPQDPVVSQILQTSAATTAESILNTMPASSQAAIVLLHAVFDSRTLVLFVSLREGRLRWRRFVNLSPTDRREYLEDWRTDPRLAYGAHALQILTSYAYYVKKEVGRRIGYDGTLLRASYLE